MATVLRFDRPAVPASDGSGPGSSPPDVGQTALELFFDQILQGMVLVGHLRVHELVLG